MPSIAKIGVLLADDHTLVRLGVSKVLSADPEIEVVGEAADGPSAVALACRLRPAVVVMDVALPGLNGIDATRQITRTVTGVHVLILSMHADHVYVRESLKAGAKGYLLKEGADVELISGVKSLARGGSYLSPAVESCLGRPAADAGRDALWGLTPREREIVQLLAEGRRTRQIARALFISPATVQRHRAHVMGKLGLHNIAEIVRFALRTGVVR